MNVLMIIVLLIVTEDTNQQQQQRPPELKNNDTEEDYAPPRIGKNTSPTPVPETTSDGGTTVTDEGKSSTWTYSTEINWTSSKDGGSTTDDSTTLVPTNLYSDPESTTTTEIFSTSSTEPPTTTKTPCPNNLQITNLISIPSSFEASLQWEPPERTDCVQAYTVFLNNANYNDTTDTQITITDLNACDEYAVSVAVFDGTTLGDNVTANFKTTPPPACDYTLAPITFHEVDNLTVTWESPPSNVINCVTGYTATWTASGGREEHVNTTNTSVELAMIGCIEYEVSVAPLVADSVCSNTSANYTVKPLPTNPPTMDGTPTPGKNSVNVTWKTDTNEENRCHLLDIVATCGPAAIETLDISGDSTNFTFGMVIQGLAAFTNYTCEGVVRNEGGNSTVQAFTFKTLEDVPLPPREVQVEDTQSDRFQVQWTPPEPITGVLLSYTVVVTDLGPDFDADDDCPANKPPHEETVPPTILQYNFTEALPYHKYTVAVFGVNGAGNGTSTTTQVTTTAANPNSVKDATVFLEYSETEQYSTNATVHYRRSCTNGPLLNYTIHYTGLRPDFPDDIHTFNTQLLQVNLPLLQPQRNYTIEITTVGQGGLSSPWSQTQVTRPGVPTLHLELIKPPRVNETTRAFFTLSKGAFDDTHGDILYYALVLLPKDDSTDPTFGFWDGTTWPPLPNGGRQLTDTQWNPFKDGSTDTVFTIKSLKEDTRYYLMVRALTSATYKDSPLIGFRTDVIEELNLALILGLVFGLLGVAVIIGFIVVVLRRRRKGFVDEEEVRKSSVSTPGPIACKRFPDYYKSIQENNTIIKSQYTAIGNHSKELGLTTFSALLPENRRKNRYTNILPYDETRVKLQIDEDDEIGSDYINASYIRGYANRIEYIATQGPLESTSKDFWKMVWQENVTVIVMVSQFIEQSKEKCSQYFPNNHEKMSFGESFEVRCSTELHFGTYCVRTLQIRKDSEQRNVYHMQFLEWPDFGVPHSTDNMLEFCHQVREKVVTEGGLIAVHCSAGVGRTGTLIALDILLQTIDHHRDINIYKTVLDLRKQRINMVQTEKQYLFIHTCVKEYLEMATIQCKEQVQDRVYENVDVLRSSMKKNLIETEVESAL